MKTGTLAVHMDSGKKIVCHTSIDQFRKITGLELNSIEDPDGRQVVFERSKIELVEFLPDPED